MEGLKADTVEFFNKSLEEKMLYKLDNDGTLQGYGQAFVFSEEQKLDWSDMFYVVTLPIALRNMKYWPTSPSTFRDNTDRYSLELTKVASGFTILLHVNDVQGLEIKKDGEWIAVSPLPNSLVVTLGETTEILSNGIYKSSEHRGMVNTENARISIAAFHNPNNSIMLGPLPELIRDGKPNYGSTSYPEFMKAYFDRKWMELKESRSP
ncbi:2-oxoglutarate (2OG) and Fe(II)-dependent oxygenase superfamily protein [Rhynchospora pubera]|uniref:2-oxoglutarate (2OG) and Fe(II)-dependent oxygenase superfamily protein n=1 Tax=Rhynchospora pubera TaxID=906938 RepID=A0AAV8CUN4_9POAL|nr:2-oxoglutarate (2OG) and Fe(II)-dependent oxygenase superfamily protein [Rhynchospora pubera]